jgi:DNA-directed RNA polymerase specialized sigma24 family protein
MDNKTYKEWISIANKITKNHSDTSDLVHDILVYLTKNIRYNELPENKRLYFFVRALKNQFYSNSSYYTRDYKKHSPREYEDNNYNLINEKNFHLPDFEWINEKISKLDWYKKTLFELYLQEKTAKSVSEKTQIPIYSVRKSINEVKEYLRKTWEIEKPNDDV